jgi:hypothetical protein
MRVGIVCDINHSFNIAISNWYYGLNNIFNNVKLINSEFDIENIDCLFIGNEHFIPHNIIWCNDRFINKCNERGIHVFVWSGEKINSSFYPYNLNTQKNLERFNHLHQRVIDVDDAKIFNKKIGSTPFSYHYKYSRVDREKRNKIGFIGSLHLPQYTKRVETINKFKKIVDSGEIPFEFECFESKFKNYEEYIDLMSQYRFILGPHSTDLNGICGRFYESLLVKSIPIQQVYDNTLDYYITEKEYKDVIYFTEVEEIVDKIKNCNLQESYNSPWLEEELMDFFKSEIGYKF